MNASNGMAGANRIGMAAHCMLALASLLGAQDVVLKAGSIDAVWSAADGASAHVQCGSRVVAVGATASSRAIPEGAVAFDWDGAALAWTDGATLRVAAPGAPETSLAGAFPFGVEGGLPPLRVPLLQAGRGVLVPRAGGVAAVDLATGATVDLGPAGARLRRARDRGFGLTGEVVDDAIVPHVFASRGREGRWWFVVGDRGSYVRVAGRTEPLPDVDLREGAAIEGFEHVVPPSFADLDRDGVPDLVRVDAVRGVVAVQGGLDRETMPAPRVILLKAPILSIDAADMTGDGAPDLLVLRLPPLTPLQQLAILMQSKLSATLLVYSFSAADGGAPAPVASIEIELGVRIVVRDQLRRAELQDLVACARGKVLIARPGGRARLLPLDGGAPVELGTVPLGVWADPLRPCRTADAAFGVLRASDGARLVRFRWE
jgi:hypothetical protein